MRKIEVITLQGMKEEFEREKEALKSFLPHDTVHHIGSTAIESLKAKPVVDILIEAESLISIDEKTSFFEQLGYEALGEYGMKERRFFQKGGDKRTHHIHVFQKGNREIRRHILFRDFMNHHKEEALAYEMLKTELAAKYPFSPKEYNKGKEEFIKKIDKKADSWFKTI